MVMAPSISLINYKFVLSAINGKDTDRLLCRCDKNKCAHTHRWRQQRHKPMHEIINVSAQSVSHQHHGEEI